MKKKGHKGSQASLQVQRQPSFFSAIYFRPRAKRQGMEEGQAKNTHLSRSPKDGWQLPRSMGSWGQSLRVRQEAVALAVH